MRVLRGPRSFARDRLGIWLLVTAAIALLGLTASILMAQSTANTEARSARDSFRFSSAEIAASLKQSIAREEDLVANTSAHVLTAPHARTPVAFDRWVEAADAMQRFPELLNIGFTELIPASRLAAFKAHKKHDPVRPFGAHGPGAWEAAILPDENRRYYCLAAAGMARSAQAYTPVGLNYCALAPTMMYDRDAGVANYAPITVAGKTTLGVATPVYATGSPPHTVAARRRAFIGWLGELLVPDLVIRRALEGHPGLAVTFTFSSPAGHASFSQGRTPAGAMGDTLLVHESSSAQARWVLQTFAPGASSGVFDHSNALVRLIGGVLLTILASSFILLLATGRRPALPPLPATTSAFEDKATHEPLTGLPNRTLVIDRALQLIARQTRSSAPTTAMFIDVDGFKEVNDTMGHAAGDELLRAIAQRLCATVREQDSVGRMSGDEFVVLFEANAAEPIDALAERLNRVLREPIALSPGAEPVRVTVSIGIACGRYATPDELLRDADIALYQAKGAGKDRFVMFSASAEALPLIAGNAVRCG